MPPDGSAPPTPGSSAPGSPAKSSKFSWGFGRKSRTPSPNGSAFIGDDDDDARGRSSPSSFVVKSVVRQPGGVSLDRQDQHGGLSQSPTNGTASWSQQGATSSGNYHNDSYKRQKSRPLMSLGVPDGGPGGGVGYGGAHSSNDGRPEAELRLAAATNAGAVLPPSQAETHSPQRSPTRPSSPGAGISAERFQRKVRDRQNSLQNSPDGRQMSPVIEPRRAADIAAEARASSQDRQWSPNPTQQNFDSHTPGRPPFGPGGGPMMHPPPHGGSLPISIPSPNWSDRNRELPGTPNGEFDAVPRSFEDHDRGRSSSPGFAGLFKGIFGRSPKVEQSSNSPQNRFDYDDEHAWLKGHGGTGNAPYGTSSPNGSAPSSFNENGQNKFASPAAQSFSAALPSPLRFSVAGSPAIPDPVEEAARRQKRESMMQAQRIVDQERQRAIDAAVQRKPSTNDSPWNPKQVLPDSSTATPPPPNRTMIDTVGRGASPIGRKPVPKVDDQDPRFGVGSNVPRKDIDPGNNALSRLEAMLTPAQKIIQEARSRQSSGPPLVAQNAVAGNSNPGHEPARGVQTPVSAQRSLESPSAIDKGKGRQLDPPEQRRETPVETPVRRISKRNTLKKENRQAQAPVHVSTPAQGSRQAQPLQPGSGPMPKDMSMSDALQDMMVRFYRFEKYSVPLLRSMEQRLLDIERDAQIALHSDGTSTTSSRDQEMDRWVSEMTGMMKHEIAQLRAACKEIKEGRDVIANVAQSHFARQKQPSAAMPTANVEPSVQTKMNVVSAQTRATSMLQSTNAAAKSPQVTPVVHSASRPVEQAVLADSASASARSSSEAGTSHFTLLTPATLKALPPSDARSSSPSSVTADPGLGVRSRTEAKPLMVAITKEDASDPSVAAHAQRFNNISSASFQSAMPIQHAKDATIKADISTTAAQSADSRRSPSPNSAGRPRYTSALGRSLLDSSTRTRSPERAALDVPRDSRLDTRLESPDQTVSEADTSRSNNSVEDRLKALLKGPTSAAAALAASPTMTEVELETMISREVASPPVTEHLRWRSKDSSMSESPNPTVRSETPSTPNGTSMHKESFFSDSTFNTTRATPPLSSSPDKTTGVFGLAPNRHLKSSSSSSIVQASTTATHTTAASPSASAGSPKKSILRNPSPTRLLVASTQPVMQSPSRRATSPAESPGVPLERADNIKTSTHASETLRARAESYLKASTEPGEGLTTRPGAWAASRFTETGSVIRSQGSAQTLDSSKDGSKAAGGIDGLPGGGSKMRSSTWLASDSTNFNLNTSNRTGAWATGQYRRTSNSNAVGANATLKEKLAFFDAAR